MHKPLHVTELVIAYDKKVLLRIPELELHAGQLAVLTGRNGSGKSSLLRSIAGLQPSASGQIKLDGLDVRGLRPMERARRVSIVLTELPGLRGIDVFTLVGMGRFPHHEPVSPDSNAHRQWVEQSLQDVAMETYTDRSLASLSDGELQKVMIARAICQDTPLILLDEPTAFLDYEAREDLMQLLRRITRSGKKAVLFSSHDLDTSLRFADLRVHLGGGISEMTSLQGTSLTSNS